MVLKSQVEVWLPSEALRRIGKTAQSTYPLRLPRSMKAEVERMANKDGVSINQFVATAVAEKLAVMNTAAFFAERRTRPTSPTSPPSTAS